MDDRGQRVLRDQKDKDREVMADKVWQRSAVDQSGAHVDSG
jgi:hypothetical protein